MTPDILQRLAVEIPARSPGRNGGSAKRSGVQLDQLLRAMEPEIRCLVRRDIQVLIGSTGPRSAPRIPLSRRDAEDLIRHLVIDASDAIPGQGCLSLVTGQAVMTEGSNLPELAPGTYATLTIRDRCHKDNRSPVVNTSITPSPLILRKGRALGLSACFEAITRAGGSFVVTRQNGETAVQIYFPIAVSAAG